MNKKDIPIVCNICNNQVIYDAEPPKEIGDKVEFKCPNPKCIKTITLVRIHKPKEEN